MMRLCLAAVFVVFTLLNIGLTRQITSEHTTWERVAAQLHASVARLDLVDNGEPGVCTAFSINEAKTYWMTAAHCAEGERLLIDGQIAWRIFTNEDHDLAVLEAPGISRPALHMASADAVEADPVGMLGYALGFEIPQFRKGAVSAVKMDPMDIDPPQSPKTELVVFDTMWYHGVSGAPVVDRHGRVVSIAQMSTGHGTGFGRPLHILREQTHQFWD